MSVIIIPSGGPRKTTSEIIEEEVSKRDYAEVSKRELAKSVGMWAYEQGEKSDKELNGSVIFILMTASFVAGIFLGAFL